MESKVLVILIGLFESTMEGKVLVIFDWSVRINCYMRVEDWGCCLSVKPLPSWHGVVVKNSILDS